MVSARSENCCHCKLQRIHSNSFLVLLQTDSKYAARITLFSSFVPRACQSNDIDLYKYHLATRLLYKHNLRDSFYRIYRPVIYCIKNELFFGYFSFVSLIKSPNHHRSRMTYFPFPELMPLSDLVLIHMYAIKTFFQRFSIFL